MEIVSRYVSRKIAGIGREILDGRISLDPYEKGSEEACTYCAYKKVCGFDPSLPGCAKRVLEELDREEILERMQEGEEDADSVWNRSGEADGLPLKK